MVSSLHLLFQVISYFSVLPFSLPIPAFYVDIPINYVKIPCYSFSTCCTARGAQVGERGGGGPMGDVELFLGLYAFLSSLDI